MEQIATNILKEVHSNGALQECLGISSQDASVYTLSAFAQGEHNVNLLLAPAAAAADAAVANEVDTAIGANATAAIASLPQFVVRTNVVSQLGLSQQILYEYSSLKLLEASSRTPRALYYGYAQPNETQQGNVSQQDANQLAASQQSTNAFLIEEFIPGSWLDFSQPQQLTEAAATLADIHAAPTPANTASSLEAINQLTNSGLNELLPLFQPINPLTEQLAECSQLMNEFRASGLADPQALKRLEQFLQETIRAVETAAVAVATAAPATTALATTSPSGAISHICILNTEAVPSHFLINAQGQGKMVDWEKPIVGEAAQDLAYFMSPTTTIWDTDFIFDAAGRASFIESYCNAVAGRFSTEPLLDRLPLYAKTNCLRGLSWSARAWAQYHNPQHPLRNEKTAARLGRYLDPDFMALCHELIFE